MSKHTPGPWEAEFPEHSNGFWHVKARREEVCTCYFAETDAALEANARLIAAAPELLSALEEILAEYEGGVHEMSPGLSVAREVVAKATVEGE